MSVDVFSPTVKQALIITCSNYDPTKGLAVLPNSINDGVHMKNCLTKFLKEQEITVLDDKESYDIEAKFDKMVEDASVAYKSKENVFFFVYYSGHGILVDGLTCGKTVYDQVLPLERFVRRLALRKNTYVASFFDCCREVVLSSKGFTQEGPIDGQLHCIFAAAPKGKANFSNSDNVSPLTDSFVKFIGNVCQHGVKNYPECLRPWNAKSTIGAEILDKTTMYLQLDCVKQEIIRGTSFTCSQCNSNFKWQDKDERNLGGWWNGLYYIYRDERNGGWKSTSCFGEEEEGLFCECGKIFELRET